MGFGKSETPRSREYSLKAHVDNLTALIEALDLKDITLVMQDWGGPIGAAYTLRHPGRVKRLFHLNTLAGYGRAEFDPSTPWFQLIRRHYDAGTLREILGHLDVNILSIMKTLGLENLSAVNSDWLAAYGSAFPTMDDCFGAIEFPLDVLLGRIFPYVAEGFPLVDHLKSKPAMLAVGMRDRAIAPDVQIADFKGIWPDGPIVKLPNAGHFSQEDAPDVAIALIQLFVQSKE
jgi:pimeloyl-ACP methyl ester carboxylesterase